MSERQDTTTQSDLPCNIPNKGKSRNWIFTLNNYMDSEIKKITEIQCLYIFQEETGELGTPHLQGTLMFRNAMQFNTIKKLLPRARIDRCDNKIASIRYCSKNDTRTGKIYSNFDYTKYDTLAQRHNGTEKTEAVSGWWFENDQIPLLIEEDVKNTKFSKEEMDKILMKHW